MLAAAEPAPRTSAPGWPGRCEVLVVGAGPAGSACARRLAGAGVDVVLVDQHSFPRDKTCGDGLLVAGEAAGSTYAFSGEGIGKALETGLIAADALLGSLQPGGRVGGTDAEVRERHQTGLQGLKPKFDLYERASRVNDHPWLADLVIWRANKSARIMARMSAVIEEKQNPGWLLSFRGMRKLLTE